MANSVRIDVGVRDFATKPFRDVRNEAQSTADGVSGAFGRIAGSLDHGRSKLREFKSASSEVAVVAGALGREFGDSVTPITNFAAVLADAGLVGHALVDLSPRFAGFVTSTLGLGAASTTAAAGVAVEGAAATATTAEIGALTVAQDAATASSLAWWSRLGLLAAIGLPVAAAVGEIRQNDDRLTEAQKKVADGSATMYDRLAAQAAAHHAAADAAKGDGAIHLDLEGIFRGVTGEVETLMQSLWAQKRAHDAAALGAKVASGYFRQFTTDAGETGAGLDNVASKAIAAAQGFTVATNSVNVAGSAAVDAANDFSALAIRVYTAYSVATKSQLALAGAGAGAISSAEALAQGIGGIEAAASASLEPIKKHTTAVHGIGAANTAAAKAISTAISDAYTKAKDAANSYADTEHNDARQIIDDSHRVRQAQIDDAHKSATERIDAEKRAVSEILDERRALLLVPVTGEEQQLRDRQNGEQRAHLQEALDAANAGTQTTDANGNVVSTVDPKAVRDATNALEEFNQQLKIDADRQAAENAAKAINANSPVSQADVNARIGTDAAAAAAAVPGAGDTSLTALDAATAAEAAGYKQRTDDETKRYATEKADADARWNEQKKKIDAQITALDKATKSTDTVAEVNRKIAALLAAAFGVTYNPKTGKVSESSSSKGPVTLGVDRGDPMAGMTDAGSTAQPVIIQVHVDGATTFDPSGDFARRLGDVLVPAILRAFRTGGMRTGRAAATGLPDHDHPLSS